MARVPFLTGLNGTLTDEEALAGEMPENLREATGLNDGAVSDLVTTVATPSRAIVSDAYGKLAASSVTSTELGYLSGATSNLQNQMDGKEPDITAGSSGQLWQGDKSWVAKADLPISDDTQDALDALDAAKLDIAALDSTLAARSAASTGVASYLALNGSNAVVKANPSWLNASDYGTAGTSAAIAAAITACSSAGGGVVFVPAGTWTVASKITIPSKVKIVGAGIDATRFVAANSLNDHMFTTTNTESLWAGTTEDGEQYWGIAECSINGNKANQTSGCGIKTYSRSYIIKNVKIESCKEQGILSRWGDGAAYDDSDDVNNDLFMEALIDNVFVQYCDKEGVYYDGPHDGRMQNCMIALNSHTVAGSYDGVYIGSRAGGFMATQCHSWGDYQRYAWNIEAASTHFSNCEGDDGYTALIMINAADCTWVGGTQIGGFYSATPSTTDKNLKGFVFGTSAHRPFIVSQVRNCPNGAIDFANLNNSGGYVAITGAIDSALQTASTGQATYGFQTTPPTSFCVNVRITGVGNNFTTVRFPDAVNYTAGSASFPALSFISDITTGAYLPASGQYAIATGGTRRFHASSDGVFAGATPDSDPAFNAAAGILLRSDGRLSIGGPTNAAAAAISRRGTDGTSIAFLKDAVTVGSISVTTTATAYNTSSDGRRKEDLRALDHALLDGVEVYDFLWKGTEARGMGVVAQELEADPRLSELVHTDDRGEKSVDYSKFVPLLIAKIKHLESLIKS